MNGAGQGPLRGLRIVEFAGMGPAPFAAMLLSDMGAEVLRIDRRGGAIDRDDILARGRASLELDLKAKRDRDLALDVSVRADAVIEGFRPGVMERLGLGPDEMLRRNQALVYGRMTGWGQEGPLASTAGHDINYIALSGALACLGPADRPPSPPLNLVGDFGGGSLYLVMGVLAALHEARASGRGQVVDAAIIDGTASLMAMALMLNARGEGRRGTNLLDGGAPFYRCYACADQRFVAVGAIEPRFYRELMQRLKINDPPTQDRANWQVIEEMLTAAFRSRTRDEWTKVFDGSDACVTPVLDRSEAPVHPQMAGRGAIVDAFGHLQPAPAPRFSRTPGQIQGPPPRPDEGGRDLVRRWGVEISDGDTHEAE